MSLWKNTDANTSAPKFPAAAGLGVSSTSDSLYANTQIGAFVPNLGVGIFGVSPNEKQGTGNVSSFVVLNAGSGAWNMPNLTVIGANTTQATTTSNTKLVSATIKTAGTGYANGNTFLAYVGANTTAGVLTITNVDGNGNVLAVDVTTAGKYSTILTPNNYAFPSNTGSGTGFTADLRFGLESVTVNAAGEGYNRDTVGLLVTGSNITDTDVRVVLTGQEGTEKGALAGWNLRKEGTGGRAGRVQYECLVAMGSLTGDGADDTQLAE